jgi:y4mF family transcriptional regulator
VKTTRKEQKLSQTELAGLAGTGLRFIVNLEQGKKSCQLQKSLDVLNALGIKIQLGK